MAIWQTSENMHVTEKSYEMNGDFISLYGYQKGVVSVMDSMTRLRMGRFVALAPLSAAL